MNTTIATLQFITDPRPGETLAAQVESVLAAGVTWVQLRLKETTTAHRIEQGRPLAALCRRYGATFIVNDDIRAAHELAADGVHLGLDDGPVDKARDLLGPEAIIGGTCNTFADIRKRHHEGVDYIGLGPYRSTATKKKLSPLLGLEGYRQLVSGCREAAIEIPVIAIGGIRPADIAPLMATSIHGVALSSLIIDSEDRAAAIATIMEELP